MKELDTFGVASAIEEEFLDNGLFFEVIHVTQEEVKEDLEYQDLFRMLMNEHTEDSNFSVDIDESKFLNDENYEKDWFKIVYGDNIVYTCLRCRGNNLEISAIEVSEHHRREGLGEIVVKGIENYAADDYFDGIKVRAFDSSAESFWKHMGYSEKNDGYLYKEL